MKLLDVSTPKFPNTFSMVDDEDFELLSQWKWYALGSRHSVYAARMIRKDCGGWGKVHLHRFIMGTPRGLYTDHRDHNGLNNQRSNLRNCTASQNQMNQKCMKGKTSRFKGVSFSKREGKYTSYIKIDGKQISLGDYVVEIDAAIAYNVAAKEAFGEFAYLNEIDAALKPVARGDVP